MASKKIKLPGTKAMGKAVLIYRQLRAEGKIGRDDAMEALNKFYGKKGQVLKRPTRYAPGRAALAAAIKNAQEKYGKTPGQSTFKEKQKKWEAAKKGAQTHAQGELPKTKAGEPDQRFKAQAKAKVDRFLNAVDVFASDTYNKMKENSYGIGSDTVVAMAEAGLSADEIISYFDQIKANFKDIPEEAKKLATNDILWEAIETISEAVHDVSEINMVDVLTSYLITQPDREDFVQALDNYNQISPDIPFSQIWAQLYETDDPGNIDTMYEIIEDES